MGNGTRSWEQRRWWLGLSLGNIVAERSSSKARVWMGECRSRDTGGQKHGWWWRWRLGLKQAST